MSDAPPTLSDVLRSYERSLIARVQLVEFASWGMADTFRRLIAEHEELQARYVAELIRRRQAADRAAREGNS